MKAGKQAVPWSDVEEIIDRTAKKANSTVSKVLKEAGLSMTNYHRWKIGKSKISKKSMRKIKSLVRNYDVSCGKELHLHFSETEKIDRLKGTDAAKIFDAFKEVLNVSKGEMAKRLGICPSTYSYWKRVDGSLTNEYLTKIINFAEKNDD